MILRLSVMAGALLCVAGAARAESGFAPGAWSHVTTMISADVPGYPQWMVKLFAGNTKRQSCYTVADTTTRPEALLTQDDAAVCKTRRFAMANGKFVYETFCTNKRFPDGLLIASQGTYTPNSYIMSTTSTGTRDGKAVRIVTNGSGQRSGPCR